MREFTGYNVKHYVAGVVAGSTSPNVPSNPKRLAISARVQAGFSADWYFGYGQILPVVFGSVRQTSVFLAAGTITTSGITFHLRDYGPLLQDQMMFFNSVATGGVEICEIECDCPIGHTWLPQFCFHAYQWRFIRVDNQGGIPTPIQLLSSNYNRLILIDDILTINSSLRTGTGPTDHAVFRSPLQRSCGGLKRHLIGDIITSPFWVQDFTGGGASNYYAELYGVN